MSSIDERIAELRDAAARLRDDELDHDAAAQLVERCAQLAADLGAALEREARAARAEPPGQERLG